MTPKEFMQGWALLVAQPYGAAYRRELDVEKTQRSYWQERFGTTSPMAWQQSVQWWIEHEDHFPLVPEMWAHLRRFTPTPAPTPATHQLVDGVSVPVDQADILAFAIEQGITVFAAVRRWRDVEAWKQPRPQVLKS